jgi:alkanesulfonate monooxygenase SsuD/methylene tetrahydromethanopterin reductase-like flavin-dependent oxidoreductase (luciferase family)
MTERTCMKVGLMLPMTESDTGIRPYRDLLQLAQTAEAVGLDSLWVCDHMLFRFPGSPARGTWEAGAVTAAVCAVTSQVEVGTLVLATAFRNPALLAKMAATLDEISDGRLVLGLGAGWHVPELTALGLPTTGLVARFAEAAGIVVQLLREGRTDFAGRYYTLPECELRPRGPRRGAIPVLIGGEGPRIMRLAARLADAWNTAWYQTIDGLDDRLTAFTVECGYEGRDLATIDRTVGLDVPAADTPALLACLRGLRQRGIGHVVCDVKAVTPDSVGWLADVVAQDRKNAVRTEA